ncbi:MAG: hypothetical protein FK734_17325 [Asgard group archaeon]|nr:hypothetical protein [Asgard group archaeon]
MALTLFISIKIRQLLREVRHREKIYSRFVNLDCSPAPLILPEFELAKQIKKDTSKLPLLLKAILEQWEAEKELICHNNPKCVEEYMMKPKEVELAEQLSKGKP